MGIREGEVGRRGEHLYARKRGGAERRAERTFLESEGEPQAELNSVGDSSFSVGDSSFHVGDSSFVGRSAWKDVCSEPSGSVESELIHACPPAAAHAFATESRPTPSLKADAQCALNPGSKMRRHCGAGAQSGAFRRIQAHSDAITVHPRTCVGVSGATPARF